MSKRTINIDEIMSRAQKKRKSSYDILDEGSKIVGSDKSETDSKKERAGASAVTNLDPAVPQSVLRENKKAAERTKAVPEKAPAKKSTSTNAPRISVDLVETSKPQLHIGSEIESFMISAARDSLNSREYKVLLCLIAETYFGKKQNVEFSLDKMGELSGVYKNHVSGVIKSLVERGAVIKTKSESGHSNRYGLNLSFYPIKSANKQS